MANLFIGFPVPRARIADMIEGSAPPIIHHDDHEDGGKDEIDCTNLVGAGGISLPFSDLLYSTVFESLDGFGQLTAGGGAITLYESKVLLETGGTSGDQARLRKWLDNPAIGFDWDKNSEFKTHVIFEAGGATNNIMQIGVGMVGESTGYGFIVENGILKAVSQVGGTREQHTISDWSAGAFDHTIKLRAHKTGASEIKFYVDDALVYTADTTIPSGAYAIALLFYSRAYNAAGGDWVGLTFSEFQFWQGV